MGAPEEGKRLLPGVSVFLEEILELSCIDICLRVPLSLAWLLEEHRCGGVREVAH